MSDKQTLYELMQMIENDRVQYKKAAMRGIVAVVIIFVLYMALCAYVMIGG